MGINELVFSDGFVGAEVSLLHGAFGDVALDGALFDLFDLLVGEFGQRGGLVLCFRAARTAVPLDGEEKGEGQGPGEDGNGAKEKPGVVALRRRFGVLESPAVGMVVVKGEEEEADAYNTGVYVDDGGAEGDVVELRKIA